MELSLNSAENIVWTCIHNMFVLCVSDRCGLRKYYGTGGKQDGLGGWGGGGRREKIITDHSNSIRWGEDEIRLFIGHAEIIQGNLPLGCT